MRCGRRRDARNPEVVGLLDIGTSKIACLIVSRPRGSGGATVLGFAYRRSRGIKEGFVMDLDEAEAAIRETVGAAERQARVEIGPIFLSVACGHLGSRHFTASAGIRGGTVTRGDVEEAMTAARSFAGRDGRTLIHMNIVDMRLDGASAAHDPCGLAARELAADLHAVTAGEQALRNLLTAVERCHLSVAGLVAAPYASALGCTTEEERRLGVTCIDMGGGTTTAAVFRDGRFVFAGTVPYAGNHITTDIARALETPLAKAARIKAVYGTLIASEADEHDVFSYPAAGEENGALRQASKACMGRIIRPRVSDVVALLAERLARGGIVRQPRAPVVVTGGSSQLLGIGEFMGSALRQPVRVAAPRAGTGMPQEASGPAFSVLTGLLDWASCGARDLLPGAMESTPPPGYLGQVAQWLRAGF